MNKLHLTILVIIINCFKLDGQAVKLLEIENRYEVLERKFKNYKIVSIDANQLLIEIDNKESKKIMHLNGEDIQVDLELIEYTLFNPQFKRLIGIDTNKVIESHNKSSVRTFRCFQLEYPNQYTALTIAPNFIYGYFNFKGKRMFIEPLDYLLAHKYKNQYVLYYEEDVIKFSEVKCGSDEIAENKFYKSDSHNASRAGCITVDVALAADKTIFDNKGGVSGSEAFMIGVLNNVQTNYDDEFASSIELSVSALFVAETSSGDPWNATFNINQHLEIHKNWANGGGYGGASYSVATAWSRKYTSGAIGVAYLGAVCSSIRYNVCSDFGGTSSALRVLQAHEMGHNFNCIHDGAGSGFIMAPSVNGSNTWSSASISAVNAFVPTLGCVGICNGGDPPVAEFDGMPTTICPNKIVHFTDMSFGFPNQWTWTFAGGTPSTSTQQHPQVIYKNPGLYDVTLKISNAFGSNSVTKKGFIEVIPAVTNSFTAYTIGNKLITENNSQDADQNLWKFGDSNTSTESDPVHTYQRDGNYNVELCATNTCGTVCKTTKVIVLTPVVSDFIADTTQGCGPLTIKFKNKSSDNSTSYFWTFPGGNPSSSHAKEPIISYYGRGMFDVSLKVSNSKFDSTKVIKECVKIETSPIVGFVTTRLSHNQIEFKDTTSESIVGIRNKILWDLGDGSQSVLKNHIHEFKRPGKYNVCLTVENSCGKLTTCNEVEIENVLLPSFESNKSEYCISDEVQFINSSFGIGDLNWEFPGSQTLSSSDNQPTIKYLKPGRYDVRLTMKNSSDSVSLVKNDYIYIKSAINCPVRRGKNRVLDSPESEEDEIAGRINLRHDKYFIIYPNPTDNGIFSIELLPKDELQKINIFDAQGKRIKFSYIFSEASHFGIQIENCHKGLYFVHIESKYNKIIEKIVVSN
ncbi:MAG: PKD domain-containing protein [Saprospiraceae bacterium]|nr:PKD domain-containing protein [Saprospiraceae bacterium]